jgi:2-keto-3-deoxy-L-rhamnonate aldolase RhmA
LFLLWGEPGIAELCGQLSVEFVVIDMEAGALGRPEVLRMAQAISQSQTTILVRVPSHAQNAIEHCLDIGAHGVLVPKVNTVEEARNVAAAARYPPTGMRGVNPVRVSGYFDDLTGYFKAANNTSLCIVQVETELAVRNADSIAATEGIDGLFIGMGDLAMDLGQPGEVVGPRIDDARAAVLAATERHGKLVGAFAYGEDLAIRYVADGFDMVAVANDIKIMREGIEKTISAVRATNSQ